MLNKEFILDKKSINKLKSKGISILELKQLLDDDIDTYLEIWHAQGLNIIKERGYYYFETKFMPVDEAVFCIVDIETNGSKIDKHQIIEIGALKLKGGKVIDKYESLVKCDEINEHITEITGISVDDTKDAPSLKDVLYKFKEFLADAVFVAHDVKFDYTFISQSLQKIGLEPLLNRTLCSLDLAQRTLTSYRYALSYLDKTFNLNPDASHHRAMSDVLTTTKLFKMSLENIDDDIKTVEDLITFSKHAKMKTKPKFDPFLESEQRVE